MSAAVEQVVEPGAARQPAEARRGPRRPARATVLRWVILLLAGIYFVGPLIAAISFTVQDHQHGGISFSAYRQIFAAPATGQIGFTTALVYSLELSAITILITLALMLPTQLLLHLRVPRARGVVETLTLLPLVFPPVVLVVGVTDTYTWVGDSRGALSSIVSYIRGQGHPLVLALLYVTLAMPFVFRTLDAGIRSIDARTLTEAARGLGAGWLTVLFSVIMPPLRTAIVNAAFLCFALVMGEYTISSILLYTKPFPVWLYQLPTTSGQVQAAVSVFSLLLVEVLLLMIGALNWRRGSQKRG